MAGRLAEILKQEYKTKGFVPGLASATGKVALEKLDLRNLLFGGSGFGSVIGRKLFGKGYSASQNDASFVSQKSFESNNSLENIRDYSSLSAKNSMALPIIASQINIMQKNVARLVKIQGGSPSQRADAFFSSAKFRENAYEQSLREGKTKTPTPLIAPQKKDSSLGLLSALALAGGAIALFGEELGNVTRTVAGVVAALASFSLALKGIAIAQGVKNVLTGPGGVPVPTPGQKTPKGKVPAGKVPRKLGRLGLAVGAITGGLLGRELTKDTESEIDAETGEKRNQGLSGLEGAAIGAAAGVGTYAAKVLVQPKLDARVQSKMGGPVEYNERANRFTQNKKFISAKDLPLEKTLERFRTYYSTLSKTPGLKSYFLKKLVAKFGIGVTIKFGAFLAGLAAAPFTAGLSTVISLASWGLTAYTVYEIYDWLFGPENNADKIEESFKLENNKKEFEKDTQRSLEETEKQESKGPIQLAGLGAPNVGAMPEEESKESIQLAGPGTSVVGDISSTTPTKQRVISGIKPVQKSPTRQDDSSFDFFKYRELVGQKESGGNYSADNKVGFIGKYQFGSMALEDMGLLKKGSSKQYGATGSNAAVYQPEAWTSGYSLQSYLSDAPLQDKLMKQYTDMNYASLIKNKVITSGLSGSDIASRLYAAHHGGAGGAAKLFKEGKDTRDFAFESASVGTSAEFMKSAYGGKGSILEQGSVQVTDANRSLNTTPSPAIINQDNRVVNNQTTSGGGGSTASAYDTELISTLIDQTTYHAA